MSVIGNRLEKNRKRLAPWAQRAGITAYRLYDRDIPEYPVIIDAYNDYFVVYDKSNPEIERDQKHFAEALAQLQEKFGATEEKIVLKKRVQRDSKTDQYTKLGAEGRSITVCEGPIKFKVNLWDYLDTGLFLDHRPVRYQLSKEKFRGKMLNLFCYTASVSVAAAFGKMQTVSVDMSRTYLDWAEENFKLNGFPLEQHQFLQRDVLQFLESPDLQPQSFDFIFLDPPTFSNSKRMQGDFDVERDQSFLIQQSMKLLKPDGVLYFSNNKRKFRLEEAVTKEFRVKDITAQTIPQDFHDQKIHHCFEIRRI